MPQGQDSNATTRIKGQLPILERQLVDQVDAHVQDRKSVV